MIKDNMLKRESEKQNQFAVKNFMIPTYHQKTHFKAARGLQMQTLESLKAKDAELQQKFKLKKRKEAVKRAPAGLSPLLVSPSGSQINIKQAPPRIISDFGEEMR